MQESLRALRRKNGEASDSDSDDDRRKKRKGPSYLEQELAKYAKGRGRAAKAAATATGGGRRGRRDEEDDLLKELGKFSKRVTALMPGRGDDRISDLREGRLGGEKVQEKQEEEDDRPKQKEGGVEEALEVDDDTDWMAHSLRFESDEGEIIRRAEEEYDVSEAMPRERSDA